MNSDKALQLTRHFPIASDRMGFLWALTSIDDCCVVEFGPAGTTHFALEGAMELNAEHRMNVYTTHLSEMDITFGRHDRLAGAIREIDRRHHPRYLFVLASSVTALIGMDIDSICRECQPETGARLIPVPWGGYDGDANLGVERALTLLAKTVSAPNRTLPLTYNMIGSTIDIFNFASDCAEMERMLRDFFGLRCCARFTAYSSMAELEAAGQAQFNFVLRAEGLPAAEWMRDNQGIPFIYGKPYGPADTLAWVYGVAEAFGLTPDTAAVRAALESTRSPLALFRQRQRGKSRRAVLYGDYDTVIGLDRLLTELEIETTALFVRHAPVGIERENHRVMFRPTEAELAEALGGGCDYAFGDDTLRQLSGGAAYIQIANPGSDRYRFTDLTPLAGIRGTLCVLERLLNSDRPG